MSKIQNVQVRELCTYSEIPSGERSWFDYYDEPEIETGMQFFEYQGSWHDVAEFQKFNQPMVSEQEINGETKRVTWDGLEGITYDSAIVVSLDHVQDGDVIVGFMY